MYIFWGAEGYCLYNDAYRQSIDSERHPGALGKPVREVWSEIMPTIGPQIEQVMRGDGATWHVDQLVPITRNGIKEDVYWTYSFSPIGDDEAPTGVGGVLVMCSETTEQVVSCQQLAISEERLQLALSAGGGIGTWDWDIPNNRVFADERFARLYGVDPERAQRGAPFEEFLASVHPDDLHDLRRSIDNCVATGEPLSSEYRLVRPDNRERWVLAQGRCIKDAHGKPVRFPGVSFDISGRKRTERKLQRLYEVMEDEVAQRTRERDRVWQSSPDLIAVLLKDGTFFRTNPAWNTLLGWTEGTLNELKVQDLIHADDLMAFDLHMQRFAESPGPMRFENRIRSKQGEYRWQQWVVVPDEDQLYCIARDIHDTRENEAALQSAQEALRQSQKMEAVGQLTGGLAHDFNNMLMGISGSLEVMQIDVHKGKIERLDHYMAMAMKSVQRASSLTHRLLAFSRRQTLAPKPTDINRLIMEMSDMILRTMGPSIATDFATGLDTPIALIDSHQLENALLNLCINASDAMPDGGRLTVETKSIWLDSRAAKANDVAEGGYALLTVTDTGVGIPPEVASRVFEPFFTTKPTGEGTGLGLSMVYGFARQSGGQIQIVSEPGQGTSMHLYLPRFIGVVERDAVPEVSAGRQDFIDQKTVLVVDDEDIIRCLITEMLRETGYTVLEAADGPTALKRLKEMDEIHLLITDVGLPGGLNGRQVADAARLLRPDLKVLFITGYAAGAAVGTDLQEDNMQVITKPFLMETLSKAVHQMLNTRP
ncbi:hypothetical protein GCM10027066_24970 [Dyella jejuensis]